jgi:hypothetical protein
MNMAENLNCLETFSESLLYQTKKENLSSCLGTDATSQTDSWTGSRDPDMRQPFLLGKESLKIHQHNHSSL